MTNEALDAARAEGASTQTALEAAQKALMELGADVAQANKDRAQAIQIANDAGNKLREVERLAKRVEELYREMCGRLKAECEKRHLGLGGEAFDALLIEALEAAEARAARYREALEKMPSRLNLVEVRQAVDRGIHKEHSLETIPPGLASDIAGEVWLFVQARADAALKEPIEESKEQ